jgi:hypothetical protein
MDDIDLILLIGFEISIHTSDTKFVLKHVFSIRLEHANAVRMTDFEGTS